jgi:predicted phosphodiesterase
LTLKKVLLIPDTHAPYHNKRAWRLMLRVAQAWKPDIIVILGDFGDFYTVSKFGKDPKRKLQLEDEVEECNRLLDNLDALGAKLKIFIEGNHEHRLNNFIKEKAPELNGLTKDVKEAFKLKERGWVHVSYRDHYRLGKVFLTHDVHATGRNAVHKVMDIYQHSAITGHTHRIGYAVEADGIGEPILSATFGWLGDITKIDYQHKITATKAYVLGFGIGYLEEPSGILFASPVPIVHYKCQVEGKVYNG